MIEIWWHGETCPMDSDGPDILFEDPDMFYMFRYNNVYLRTFNYGTHSYVIE